MKHDAEVRWRTEATRRPGMCIYPPDHPIPTRPRSDLEPVTPARIDWTWYTYPNFAASHAWWL